MASGPNDRAKGPPGARAGAKAGPRAPMFGEEERTTVEHSGWEEGTTVDDGAEALPPRPGQAGASGEPITATGGTLDELTIDEQPRPGPAPMLTPLGMPGLAGPVSRLVVVAGPDVGRGFDLPPGQALTVGRALDNAIVLADIAVSRKHFTLHQEGDRWILSDRGSGNGTVVNDRLEDHPIGLGHGDQIELGNTVLRFDHLTPGAGDSPPGWSSRDDEARTTDGRAFRDGDSEVVLPALPPGFAATPATRPAPTMPPPAGRAHQATVPPQARPARPLPNPPPRRPPTAPPPPPAAAQRRAPTAPPPMPTPEAAPSAELPRQPTAPYGAEVPRPAPRTTPPPVHAAASAPLEVSASPPLATSGFSSHARRPTIPPVVGATTLPPTSASTGPGPRAPMPAYLLATSSTRRRGPTWRPWAVAGGAAVLLGVMIAFATSGDRGGGSGAGVDLATRLAAPDATLAAVVPVDAPVIVDAAPPVDAPVIVDAAPPVDAQLIVDAAPPVDAAPQVVTPTESPREKAARERREKAAREKAAREKAAREKATRDKAARDKNPVDVAAAQDKAERQYEAGDFKAASTTLRAAAAGASGGDKTTLTRAAADYDAVAKGLGAAKGSAPVSALAALKKAVAADRRSGRAHESKLKAAIATVAPKAATASMAAGNLEAAYAATVDASAAGAGGVSTVKLVQQALEKKAGELYASGIGKLKSDPAAAKAALGRIKKIVPKSSPWYQKAAKALAG
ncbi:MAG: FHA domain-containing protein [Kofleriaceae bacterium]